VIGKCGSACLIATVLIALLVGCAEKHVVSLNASIRPAASATKKLSASVAVVCPDSTKSYRKHVQAITLNGHLHSYDFEIGPALCKALLRSVGAVYLRPVEIPKMPPAGKHAAVVVFSIQHGQIDVAFEDNPFKASARASSALAVAVELFEGKTLTFLHSSTLNGKAFLIRPLEKVSSPEAQKVFAAAIEASIQQLSDNAVTLLEQWAAGQSASSRAPARSILNRS